MTYCIEKSGTGIEKSGTGIEKSGTGLGRSETDSQRGAWGAPRAMTKTKAMIASVVFCAAAIAQASEPNFLLTQSEQGVQVSMHIDGTIVVGGYVSPKPLSGLLQFDLYDVNAGNTFATQTHGSGTGYSTDTHGSGTGYSTDTHGSGTGYSTDTHGSGTGYSTDTHGSGTGYSTDTHGSGTGYSTDTHGSGTGQPESGDSSGFDASAWGQIELVVDPDATYILVHRYSEDGLQEVLATSRAVPSSK